MVGSQADAVAIRYTAILNGQYNDIAHYFGGIGGTDHDNSISYTNQEISGEIGIKGDPSGTLYLTLSLPDSIGSFNDLPSREAGGPGYEFTYMNNMGGVIYHDQTSNVVVLSGDGIFADSNDINSIDISKISVIGSGFTGFKSVGYILPEAGDYTQIENGYELFGQFTSFTFVPDASSAVPEPAS